jgi:hypothetical protein
MACSKNDNQKNIPKDSILVLGHTYRWGPDGNRVDERLENLDYSKYKELWLLGDVCAATTREKETLDYLDDLFDLSKENVKWAIGNHDIDFGKMELISNKTKREFFYGDVKEDYASFVLNTQMEDDLFRDSCDYKQKQHDTFVSFLEDIKSNQDIKTLFILSHNTVWSDAEESLRKHNLIGNANAAWIDFLCQWASEFRHLFLPHLIEIQNSGVNVICIAGDGGQYQKTFFEKAESGISYYVSGINNSVLLYADEKTIDRFNTEADSVLIFNYNKSAKSFIGEFFPVGNL